MGDKSITNFEVNDNSLTVNRVVDTFKYWTLVTIDGSGQRKLKEIGGAKTFFNDLFQDVEKSEVFVKREIQTRLLEIYQNNTNQSRLLAKRCLLCFISWQIELACLKLAKEFGDFHGFTKYNLLPYVLDDDGSLEPINEYQCLSREILETFDSQKSNLNSWTSRKVRQNRELSKFLLEQGVYIITDWAILNDTKPHQLPKILGEYHSLNTFEIERLQILLTAYHKVYRKDRLQKRTKASSGKCNPPNKEQLKRISRLIANTEKQKFTRLSNDELLEQLQTLATYLRQYRIDVRGAYFPTESLDKEIYGNSTLLESIAVNDSELNPELDSDSNPIQEFLKAYRLQMSNCLDKALHQVTESRVKKLIKKDINSKKDVNTKKYITKANLFIQGLYLFHCQRLSMSTIAERLGLKAQYEVTRLLKLKDFRADVRRETLISLQETVIEIAKNYSTPEALVNLEKEIHQALDEQIDRVISQAETEAATIKSNVEMSTFSEKLCQQLQKRDD
ncbi:MAG: hypothetical protein AAF208_11640 [Cyanobacteria bacterium P01_A01_bin.45]